MGHITYDLVRPRTLGKTHYYRSVKDNSVNKVSLKDLNIRFLLCF